MLNKWSQIVLHSCIRPIAAIFIMTWKTQFIFLYWHTTVRPNWALLRSLKSHECNPKALCVQFWVETIIIIYILWLHVLMKDLSYILKYFYKSVRAFSSHNQGFKCCTQLESNIWCFRIALMWPWTFQLGSIWPHCGMPIEKKRNSASWWKWL